MPQHKQHEEESFTLKEKLAYSMVGLVVLSGSFFIGRSIVRQARSTSEEKKTYDDTNAAYYAQKLKMAFENDNAFGWGTDKVAVREVLRMIPSKEVFKLVINSYQKLYARSLMADLKSELTLSEYSEMLGIVAGKPDRISKGGAPLVGPQQYQAWARRLKAAFDITYWGVPGTDEEAVRAVFLEIPTQTDYQQVTRAYQREFGRELGRDLKSELEFWEYSPMMDIIMKKPK
ncbi:hypothetical protein [Flaviaesturariibacter aridisoli]|uniref:Annexin n=1 Tax=Flaviaesturariibacter aridisoli TaxID=2545761 RepID=A0A4R4DWJ0_9BACT|nr:hypothetical protein [Flaviaesturariibacter aridisoli]TCZ68352.1 hypothetical protein E0486_14265 [Flaviaesturariibacter aridisoli]